MQFLTARIVAVKWSGRNVLIARKVFLIMSVEKILVLVKTQNRMLFVIIAMEKKAGGFAKNVLEKRTKGAKRRNE